MPPLSGACGVLPDSNFIGRKILIDSTLLIASTIPYGAQLVLQWICVKILRRPPEHATSSRTGRAFLLVATLLMLVSSTVSLGLSATHSILDGIAISNDAAYDSHAQYFEGLIDLAGNITKFLNIWIGDAIVFWRAWVLWRHKRKAPQVYIPALLLVCTAVCVLSVLFFTILTATIGRPSEEPSSALFYLTFGLSAATNLATNASIGLHRKAVREYLESGNHHASHEKLLMLLLESGAIYTVLL
ncbi:hypothetical protein VNI00_006320, partial [Paramarasmius palmivorus]